MRRNLPDKDFFIGKKVPGLNDYKIIELIGSGNDGHVFKAHSDVANNILACKIIPSENKSPSWREEYEKPNALRHPAVVKFLHVLEWEELNNKIDCVVLCSEYVPGKNLEKHITGKQKNIDINFIERFLNTMFSIFHDMKKNRISHGDLHERNILVEDRTDQLGGDPYVFRVTDFGVAGASSDKRLKDDYEQLAHMLRLMLNEMNYQELYPRERFFFNIFNDEFLGVHLGEKDTTRNPLAMDPNALFNRLDQIDDEFNKSQQQTAETKLLTPFDYLSCEQIGESYSLLKALYSDKFLGLTEIESRSNLILTGTRGCGKSTVFKSLSLKHRYRVGSDNPGSTDYIGIYYRCDDLYSAFPRYRLPERQEAYDIPMHYLTATLTCEVLDTIENWAKRHFKDEFSRRESKIAGLIWELIKIEKPGAPGADSFKTIISRLQEERLRARDKQRIIHDPKHKIGNYFGPEILPGICEILIKNLAFLGKRPFYFFIDDYSKPKITDKLQENLNRLLMQRTAACFFKISTESPVSYCRSDIDGKAYVEGREFKLYNLALVYLSAKTTEKLKFIEDIFAKRFNSMEDYPIKTIDEIVGNYELPSSNKIALIIREGKKPEMWGKQVLCRLCSGDIYYIIELVGKMVSRAGGIDELAKNKESPKINSGLQRRAIREEAGLFLENLRRIEGGDKLVEVVNIFGNVAHSYLKHKDSKNEDKEAPHQASRIEPNEALNLSDDAEKIYTELLRYSLFIEDPRGKSIRGKVVPRLYLRRSLLPHFNLTFNTRDSLRLDPKDIECLLLNPGDFEKRKCLKKEEKEEKENIQNSPLFKVGKNGKKD
ncbi:MAG: protein kinase family protein [Candidatus Aminicenantes bacterium]|nr:protein kinase family protein [Candidatus Aminicenantes bacterium]